MSNSWKLTLPCTRAEAEALNDDISALSHLVHPPTIVTEEREAFNDATWQMMAYFDGYPEAETVALVCSLVPSAAVINPDAIIKQLERLDDEDWLTASQRGIAPVHAGRFYIHTGINKGVAPPGAQTFRIEAGQAFGTGGHETTTGCVLMIDALKRRGKRFDHIADIGTGTGLLAFVARHLWPRAYFTASDIDPISIDVTAENANANGVSMGQGMGHVALCVASGTDHPLLQRRAPYDLLIANILAGPLIELAPSLADVVADGGTLILAGLLDVQADTVAAAYRRCGFHLAERRDTGIWPCLRFVKRRRYGWQRPSRAQGRTSQLPGDYGTW
jgi:ribosomal protein L11 methyltransferase